MFPPASCRNPADSQRIQAVVWSQEIDRVTLDFQVLTAGHRARGENRFKVRLDSNKLVQIEIKFSGRSSKEVIVPHLLNITLHGAVMTHTRGSLLIRWIVLRGFRANPFLLEIFSFETRVFPIIAPPPPLSGQMSYNPSN